MTHNSSDASHKDNRQVNQTVDNNMNEQTQDDSNNSATTDGVRLALDYRAPSQVVSELNTDNNTNVDGDSSDNASSLSKTQASEHAQHVALFAQLNRAEVSFHRVIKSPLVFRDTLLALFDIVSSDYRYVPKDRSAYTVFMQMRRANANKNLFAAQRDYFTWLFNNDPLAFCILDPIIQVHQDGVSFEVFSRDEGCYAQLTLTHDLFEAPQTKKAKGKTTQTDQNTIFGTTSIDYSTALYDGINQIRDYQQTILDIGHEAVGLTQLKNATTQPEQERAIVDSTDITDSTEAEQQADSNDNDDANDVANQIIEKRINVPKSWIRALLQVQSAGQLATDTIQLDPIALYNVLFELRMHADIKGSRRGLLIELQPQQAPVIILEPFNIAVTNKVSKSRFVYQGKQAKIIRLWGRRRLSLLKRLLPHTDSVSVSLLGQGMPSYWTLTGKGFHFTFAMTGFSQANWSQSLNFDLLLPKRPEQNQDEDLQPLLTHLADNPSQLDDLKKPLAEKEAINQSAQSVPALLVSAAQQGFIRYDIATQTYYYRPLTQTPLDMAQFAHHNAAEKHAYDLISRPDAVQNLVVKTIPTKGVAIQGDIKVSEDRRTYHSQLQLNIEGMVARAECSCPQYLQHRLTQGACAHLITLRLAYNAYDRNLDSSADNNGWHETRVLSKRLSRKQQSSQSTVSNVLNKKVNHANHHAVAADTTKQPSYNDLMLDLSALANQSAINSNSNSDNNAAPLTTQTAQMAMIYITIEHKKVLIEQVIDDKTTRQQLVFNQPKQAHDAFLQHIARFEAKGFIENQGV